MVGLEIINFSENSGKDAVKAMLERNKIEYGSVQGLVDEIVADVRKNGDKALFSYTEKFDKVKLSPENIRVSPLEIEAAYNEVDKKLIDVIKKTIERVRAFHEKQKQVSWLDMESPGELLGQKVTPVESAGVYVPGGKAAYPSTVVMNVVPAKVAGVNKIVMVTPCGSDGKVNSATLVAAKEAGVTEIYKIGGAQAVAALAFGTESVPRVDKITGPGNIYVAYAKRAVFGYVSIDSIAGPSEILIIADNTAKAEYVAADMLSQAEHDEMAAAILVTTSESLAKEVKIELEKQTAQLSRKQIIEKSLEQNGAIILTEDLNTAIDISNEIAPEHLEICTENPFEALSLIKNAGAIFLGNYTPEPLGDYMAGPNHVLPTSGTAKFFSPLGVDDFVKKSSILHFSKQGFKALSESVITFAEAEGLTAHANSVRVRLSDK